MLSLPSGHSIHDHSCIMSSAARSDAVEHAREVNFLPSFAQQGEVAHLEMQRLVADDGSQRATQSTRLLKTSPLLLLSPVLPAPLLLRTAPAEHLVPPIHPQTHAALALHSATEPRLTAISTIAPARRETFVGHETPHRTWCMKSNAHTAAAARTRPAQHASPTPRT